jgi:hypothetical protein
VREGALEDSWSKLWKYSQGTSRMVAERFALQVYGGVLAVRQHLHAKETPRQQSAVQRVQRAVILRFGSCRARQLIQIKWCRVHSNCVLSGAIGGRSEQVRRRLHLHAGPRAIRGAF